MTSKTMSRMKDDVNNRSGDAPSVGAVPADAPTPAGIRRLQLVLIKPSKYDDEGYVMRYFRGVLPSNTLAAIASLSRQVADQGILGDVELGIEMMDEHVQKIDARKIARKYRKSGTRVVVGLCGVQTNQFPRAADLAREFHALGVATMIGGFHVSGAIAMSETGIPPECQALIDEGITLVKGEIEEVWGELLRDALHGRLKTYYDIVDRPDLSKATLPVVDRKLMKRFAYPYMGTIDAGRGCPFNCSFCTIINVQGRKMRHRLAEQIKEQIRGNLKHKIDYYFFTDDNFSRNKNWEGIFDALIELREEEGIKDFQFMMQIDTIAYKIKNFMSKAIRAGCTQVFIGMETINPDNIQASGKTQNRVEDYRNMIDLWHAHGVACHVGYIIGFPADTVDSVRDDVRRLRDEIGVDQASFFILTPLPGSRDHTEMARRGEWMDEDYNRFDSFHTVSNHSRMGHEEWFGAYQEAWRNFYDVESMKATLARSNDRTYWGLFKNFIWYKYSVMIEQTHPMICGFLRFKDRTQRRPGFEVEPLWTHARRRSRELLGWARGCASLYFEMQEVWLATRGRDQILENMADLRRRYDDVVGWISQSTSRMNETMRAQITEICAETDKAFQRVQRLGRLVADDLIERLQELRTRLSNAQPELAERLQQLQARIASLAPRRRLNPLAVRTFSREQLNQYWRQTWNNLHHGRLHRINPFKLGINFLRDAKLCARFNFEMVTGYHR